MFQSVEVQTDDKKTSTNRAFLKRKRAPIEFSLRVRNIGVGVRVRDLKVALSERGVKPRYHLFFFCFLFLVQLKCLLTSLVEFNTDGRRQMSKNHLSSPSNTIRSSASHLPIKFILFKNIIMLYLSVGAVDQKCVSFCWVLLILRSFLS